MALKLPNLATVQKGSIGVDAVAEKWTTLSSALDQIYALKQSNCSFQVLHQASYQLVLHNHGEVLYKKLEEKIAARITLQKDIIRNAAINMSATKLLITLAEQWAIHEVTTRRTCDIFPHLERVYCQSAKKQLIGPMSTRHFGTIVLSDREICEASLKAFYDMVDRDRRGDEAPQFMLLRSISNIFVAVDRATFFEGLLEKRYIELTKHFYTQEASQMAGSENVPLYIEHYNKRLQDEIRRAASCMDTTTVQQVERIVTSCFITAHGEEIINKETSGVHALLREWRLPELTAIYQAFARVFATGEVILSMAAFLRTEGTIIVTNTEYIENPVTFVEKIIDLRGKIDVLLRDVMVRPDKPGIDRYAEVELLRAFDDVVNRQSFTADYLSRLLDAKLRSQCSDSEIDKISEQIMSIFGRLRDKDVFESAYRNHLARRLLLGRSSSGEDQERIFIAKLKRECGVSATSSLEGMFADRATSDDLMDKFRDKLEERGERIPVALSVFVLTSSFWPPPVELKMRLHPDMARSAKIFEMYYLNRHHGRKFEYSFANGSVDIRLNFGGKKYDLNVPVMCSTVLLACEDDEFRTLEDLAGQSGMTVSDTAKAVASLARPTPTNAAILITDSAGSSVNAATKVKFNGQFKAKQLKIRVAIAVSTKEKTGASAAAPSKVREQIDEDRKYKIDAAVVRIMKSRKVLDHSTLLAEVIGVTKTFCPSPDMIKKRIEHLIEREFLERAEDDRNVYHYLA